MTRQAGLGLEFLAADSAGFVVVVGASDLVLHIVVEGLEVFVAPVTIVMLIRVLLVAAHILFGVEKQSAALV